MRRQCRGNSSAKVNRRFRPYLACPRAPVPRRVKKRHAKSIRAAASVGRSCRVLCNVNVVCARRACAETKPKQAQCHERGAAEMSPPLPTTFFEHKRRIADATRHRKSPLVRSRRGFGALVISFFEKQTSKYQRIAQYSCPIRRNPVGIFGISIAKKNLKPEFESVIEDTYE